MAEFPAALAASFPHLLVLDWHDNLLATVTEDLGSLQQLKRLDLSRNRLVCLPRALGWLQALTHLNVSHNTGLRALPEDIAGCTALETLVASCCGLAMLPEGLGQLANMRTLDVSHNVLSALPATLGRCRSLVELTVNNNSLSDLPDALQHLVALVRLDARFNLLTQPPRLGSTLALAELHLGNNRLRSMQKFIDLPGHSLQILDLRDNQLLDLAGVEHLTALKRLDVANNHLRALPAQLATIRSLAALSVDGNPLKSIRPGLVAKGSAAILQHLKHQLPLDQQHPDAPATKESLPPLRIQGGMLVLSRQALANMPLAAMEVTEVKGLDLSDNQFTEWPGTVALHWPDLETICLGANRLTSLTGPALTSFSALKCLDLRQNQLSVLPAELGLLVTLEEVVLSCNKFTALPLCLFQLLKLTALVANDNQVRALCLNTYRG